MAIDDILLLATGAHGDGSTALNRSNAVIRLFPVWRYAEEAGPASSTGCGPRAPFRSTQRTTMRPTGLVVITRRGQSLRDSEPLGPGRAWVSCCDAEVGCWTGAGGGDVADRRGAVFRFATVAGGVYDVEPAVSGRPGYRPAKRTTAS